MSSEADRLREIECALKTYRRSALRDRLAIGVLGVIGLVLALGGMAQPEKAVEELRAKRFVIVDDNGQLRVLLGVLPDGNTGISIFDETGITRAMLAVNTDDSTGLGLSDAPGKTRAQLGVEPVMTAMLSLLDSKGALRAGLSQRGDDTGLLLQDHNDRGRQVWLSVDPDFFTGLSVMDLEKATSAELGIDPDGSPRQRLYR
jgi:hypothetical protein